MTLPRLVMVVDSEEIGQDRSGPGAMDYAIGFGMVALLIFGVLAFGAVDEWSVFVLEAGAASIMLLWLGRRIWAGDISVSNPLLALAAAFAAIVAAQLVFKLSVYPYGTKYKALEYGVYAAALIIGSEGFKNWQLRRALMMVLSAFVTLYAAFALIQNFTSNGKLYWIVPLRFGGWMYGSYVNHAHYSGLVEMLVPFPLVLAAGHRLGGPARILAGFGALLAGVSIFLSGSRGGMISCTVGVLFLGLLHFRRERKRATVVAYVVFCLAFVLALGYLNRGDLLARFKDLNPVQRWQVSIDSVQMVRERPLLGWGLGNFATAYPRFRTFYTNNFVNEAHNDYAQVLVETGIIGFAVVIWFLVALFWNTAARFRQWQQSWSRSAGVAAMVGLVALLIHSFVDFNLQIPANAAVFFFLCGLASSTQRSDE